MSRVETVNISTQKFQISALLLTMYFVLFVAQLKEFSDVNRRNKSLHRTITEIVANKRKENSINNTFD